MFSGTYFYDEFGLRCIRILSSKVNFMKGFFSISSSKSGKKKLSSKCLN